MVASGSAELISLGAVIPFLAVLSDPDRLWHQPLVQPLAVQFGLTQPSELLIPTTLLFAAAAVLAASIRLTNLWFNGRLAASVGSDLSCDAYRLTLYQPYEVHLKRNSSEVITSITTQINATVNALNALLQLFSSAVVAVFLLFGLLMINAPVALAAAAIFGTVYTLLASTIRYELHRNGQKIALALTRQVKALQEGLGAIRDVLLDSSQPIYIHTYRQADGPQRQLRAKNSFLGAFPRYALEALGMVVIALLGGGLVLQQTSGSSVIPLLGVLALGAQRLLPALQQIYSGWASLKGSNAAIQDVLSMLNQPQPLQLTEVEPLSMRTGIRFQNLRFRYGSDQSEVLCGINLEISRGDRIGLIGSTGSGKSTTVDLLMGLLEPSDGQLLVDGADIHDPFHPERLAAWRAAIAHVPQNVYLTDGSIAENIAFGLTSDQIDMDKVVEAARYAHILDFIKTIPDGFNTHVGERGIRLSGGQKQRIGIARAFYKKAQILIFDEATSALDNSTEKSVMDAINSFGKDFTIVIIAHRLTTVQDCDRVIKLEDGLVASDGHPRDILNE